MVSIQKPGDPVYLLGCKCGVMRREAVWLQMRIFLQFLSETLVPTFFCLSDTIILPRAANPG